MFRSRSRTQEIPRHKKGEIVTLSLLFKGSRMRPKAVPAATILILQLAIYLITKYLLNIHYG